MNTRSTHITAIDPDDIGYNDSNNPDSPSLTQIVETRLSRRNLFRGALGTAGSALLGSAALAGCGGGDDPVAAAPTPTPAETLSFNFATVAKSLADVVTVPVGYTASVMYRLGDPIATGVAAYSNVGTDDPTTYDRRAGDHHDGMTYFGMSASGTRDATSSSRALLVMNHEAITPKYLHAGSGQTIVAGARTVPDEVLREFYLHGVSVIEINKSGANWSYKVDSTFNRRVHTLTPMTLSGPAAGNAQLITKYSATGVATRGTVNNCANGTTPWGTYLTCEENWAGYFKRDTTADNPSRSAKEITALARVGVAGTGRELWSTVTPDTTDNLYGRWRAEVVGATAADDYRNVANTYGWVVEIDPFTPGSTPRKRTALGRFGHEGAVLGPVVVGKPLVWYMGDDSRNEYLYKFVSSQNWVASDANGGLAAGDKYMDSGKLYVAKFNADGSGQWIELSFGVNGITAANPSYAFADQADVLINARLAADVVGATKMDRPEWTAVNPNTSDVYLTLTNTNSTSRPVTATDAANPRYYNDLKGATNQRGNPNGHVIRFNDGATGSASLAFKWDVYLFGARSTANSNINISGLTAENDFSSPDGMWFSQAAKGLMWLQTDDGAYTDVTNCMMLAALPGKVGDGGVKTITNASDLGVLSTQQTIAGAAPTSNTLRRFLVGPKECEITGIAESADGRAIFVNIQHPGEDTAGVSNWPDGGSARPRSATIVITKNDGGRIAV